jgi:NitT/TauT family transport system permease protein
MNARGPQFFGRVLPPVIVMIVTVALLEAFLRLAEVKPYMMALPSDIARSMWKDREDLLAGLGWTALAALGGFAASALIGVLAAVLLASSGPLRRAIYPYTVFFQTVPIIAIAPLLLFWFQSGLLPVAICAFIVSVFPVIANTLAGLLSTDPALVDLFRLYGAGKLPAMWKLRLPSALPNIFTGLRVAAGLAVIGSIVAEFFVGEIVGHVGLGVLIVYGIHQSRLDLAFAAVLFSSFLGIVMFALVNAASWWTLKNWHASER